MSPKIVDKNARRLEIAAVAGVLFGKYGFDKVTVDSVAKAAGIGKGTVYEYFQNKEALIDGAFETLMTHMMTHMTDTLDLTLRPLDALRKLTFSMVDALNHVGEQYGFFLEYILMLNRGGGNAGILTGMLTEYRQMVGGLLEAAVDAGQVRANLDIANAAASYAAWFDGAIFHWMTIQSPDLKTLATAFWDFFVSGITPREEAQIA
ncbi:MAG: TetR/AcrR family transcriptional regulator [Deltaproteobacteria bacterium]|nr:TetR/AcrR family transcriptional regulator [Deltaproteobacteria bacterium]